MANDLEKLKALLEKEDAGLDRETLPFVEDYLARCGINLPTYDPDSAIPAGLSFADVVAIRFAAAEGEPSFAIAHDYHVKEQVITDLLEYRSARHAGGPALHTGTPFGLDKRLYMRNSTFKEFAAGVAAIASNVLTFDLYDAFVGMHGHTPQSFSELKTENIIESPTAAESDKYRTFIRRCASKAGQRTQGPRRKRKPSFHPGV